MSSNKSNGVTSPSKVKELAGIFQGSELAKTGPTSPLKQQEAKATRRSYAVGKTSIVIEDKDSKQQLFRAKPGTKVGDLAQNYHHPHPTVKVPKPIPTTPPLVPASPTGVVLRSNSRPASPMVNGVTGFNSPTMASVRITSWDESKTSEIQPTESVKARAARMNSQPDQFDASRIMPSTPGRKPQSYLFHTSSPVNQNNEPKIAGFPADDEDVNTYQSEYQHEEQEDEDRHEDHDHEEHQEDNDHEDHQEDNDHEDRQEDNDHEDRQEDNDHEDRHEENDDEDHHQEEDNEEDQSYREEDNEEERGYREENNEEQDSREEDTSSYNAEAETVHEREDDGLYQEPESNQDEDATRAEEADHEETRSDDGTGEDNVHAADNDNDDESNEVEEDSNSPVNGDDE